MTLKRFIVNNNGKKVDFDGHYGYQCVDLARLYFNDVLEIKQLPPVDGAKDLWENHGELKQSKDAFAPGDVLIYGATDKNPYGHVCILTALLDSDTFIVFEQNGFEQSGAKLTVRDRTNLIGCLYK
jgi:N-acetylmuramoyl-L-alanine amidase